MRRAAKATRSSNVAFICPSFIILRLNQMEAFGCSTCSRLHEVTSSYPADTDLSLNASYKAAGRAKAQRTN